MKVLRGMVVEVERRVTHTTFTQETGVHLPSETKHQQSGPQPNLRGFYLNFTTVM